LRFKFIKVFKLVLIKMLYSGYLIFYGGEVKMVKHRKDPSKAGLGSSEVEGQGTTNTETGQMAKDSSRKKQKRM